MSQIEIGELLGTLSRDKQRAGQPLNQFYADQNKQLLIERTVAPIEDYSKATHEELRAELNRQIKLIKQHIEEIQNEQLHVDELQKLNDAINHAMDAKHEISRKLDRKCPKKGYKYFGAFRDYILSSGNKKLVKEIQESSDSEEENLHGNDEVPFSFERRKRQLKVQHKVPLCIKNKSVTDEKHPNNSLDGLESKIYKHFGLKKGYRKFYGDPKNKMTSLNRFAKYIEFDEERLMKMDKESENRFRNSIEAEKLERNTESKLLQERKSKILEKYG